MTRPPSGNWAIAWGLVWAPLVIAAWSAVAVTAWARSLTGVGVLLFALSLLWATSAPVLLMFAWMALRDRREIAAMRVDEQDLALVSEALAVGLDLAREHAAQVHEALRGYKPEQHARADQDVTLLERAVAAQLKTKTKGATLCAGSN